MSQVGVRLPAHAGEKARKVARVRNELSAELGREPTDEEIAESLGWAAREVSNLTGLLLDAASLDRSVGAEDDAPELGELVEDERASEAPDAVIREMENDRLRETIERMPDRERCVLVRRYGLDDQEPATLAAVGTELGVTRERVRQLQRKAERQLRGLSVPALAG